MEAAIVTLVFMLSPVAYVALHARAGLAEDALWSRQQMLSGHGVRLGLPYDERATARARRGAGRTTAAPDAANPSPRRRSLRPSWSPWWREKRLVIPAEPLRRAG